MGIVTLSQSKYMKDRCLFSVNSICVKSNLVQNWFENEQVNENLRLFIGVSSHRIMSLFNVPLEPRIDPHRRINHFATARIFDTPSLAKRLDLRLGRKLQTFALDRAPRHLPDDATTLLSTGRVPD